MDIQDIDKSSSSSDEFSPEGFREKPDPYVADAPAKHPDQDHFQRWPFAQRVAQVIATRQDPSSIVISINGAWGEGKSTVLNFIEYELKQHSHVVCLHFNPWRFPDESTLLFNFFTSLANAVDKSVSTVKERVGDLITKYGTPFASLAGQGDTAKAFGNLLASVDIEELRNRVETILKEAEKRVVVLMDDIDRLDKGEIQAIFRLVKLSADFDHMAYILAFDNDIVSAALQERYSSRDPEAGQNFLEKIIQVPLNLPQISVTSLREYCFRNIEQAIQEADIDISEQQGHTFVRHFIDGLEVRLQTPRMAKRYKNILAFSLPILKGEVNPVDLMLIEGIRVFYPTLYATIARYPDVFLGRMFRQNWRDDQTRERSLQIINDCLKELNLEEQEAAKKLFVVLFPQTGYLFGGSPYSSDWEGSWADKQHIASRAYFSRYFSYSVPRNEVSDQQLALFVGNLDDLSVEEISQELKQIVKIHNTDNFLSKLRPQAPHISTDTSRKLAEVISKSGEIFPHLKQAFSFLGPFSQAAILVSNLIDNIPDSSDRMDFVVKLLREAEPIMFALEILHWLNIDDDENKGTFSSEQGETLGSVLAKRIQDLAKEQSLFKLFGNEVARLLHVWARWGSKTDTTGYIEKMLNSGEIDLTEFLTVLTPTAYIVNTGTSFKKNFERREYDSLAAIIDPALIYQRLDEVHTKDVDATVYPRNFLQTPSGEMVVKQFVWLHNRVIAEETQNNPEDTVKEGTASENIESDA